MSASSSNAIALRRWRARKRRGAFIVRLEVDERTTRTLYALRYLSHADRGDRLAVARAIEQFLRDRLTFEPSDLRRATR